MFDITFNPYQDNSKLINDDILKILNENFEKICFYPDSVLTPPNEYPDCAYLIISGSVQMSSIASNGKESILSILGTGAFLFTYPILLNQSSAPFFVKTIELTETYKMPRDNFLSLYDSSSDFRDIVTKDVCNAMYMVSTNLSNFTLYSHNKILYDLLVSSIDKNSKHDNNWYSLNNNFNRYKLSELLGVSRSTLQRTLLALRNENKIRILNNEIEVRILGEN